MRRTFFLIALAVAVAATATAQRPPYAERCFRSQAVEACITGVCAQLTNRQLRQMFAQCFPNTLDTTVRPGQTPDGDDDTFVITGDIPAMWLRDSSAQVWPYLRFAGSDPRLGRLLRGVLRRQLRCLLLDPYANAFNASADAPSKWWQDDLTTMRKGVFERKYELDSPLYVLRLAHGYWQATADTTAFDALWLEAVRTVLHTLRTQQQPEQSAAAYTFMRRTHALHDTRSNSGAGHPARRCGLIASAFRPSDDSTVFPYLIPSNFFAVSALRKAADVVEQACGNAALADSCRTLAAEVEAALREQAVAEVPGFGRVYAYEVDGYGSRLLMDDANIPSLLSLPYIADVPASDSIYQNTRRFVWSHANPYFFSGPAGEGIGGPHEGLGYIWPMSDIMLAMTSSDEAEIRACLRRLMATTAGTGFMHEAYRQEDATRFTRAWFAWANTLFGELILKLIDDGRLPLLNAL